MAELIGDSTRDAAAAGSSPARLWAGTDTRMAACGRPWSCCTASPAPGTRGTESAAAWARKATCRSPSTCPGTVRRPGLSSRSPSPAASSTCWRDAPERFALAGYSLGGRIALQVALAAPERVARLLLVSTSAGICDADGASAQRRLADRRLADDLERLPFESFIERWRTQPLFAGDPPEVDALAREDQRRNRPDALAAVLRGIGSGEMEPLWGRLGELTMPVLIVVGDRDAKYRALGERLERAASRRRADASCRAVTRWRSRIRQRWRWRSSPATRARRERTRRPAPRRSAPRSARRWPAAGHRGPRTA